jgi:hypothetical protein
LVKDRQQSFIARITDADPDRATVMPLHAIRPPQKKRPHSLPEVASDFDIAELFDEIDLSPVSPPV